MQAFIGIKLQRRPSTLRFASFSITRVVAAKLPGHACDMMGFAEIRLVVFFSCFVWLEMGLSGVLVGSPSRWQGVRLCDAVRQWPMRGRVGLV